MTSLAVRVEGIGKQYQLGLREKRHQTFREAVVDMAAAPWRRLRHLSGRAGSDDTFWALKDISFDVPEGEVLGIIGHNGAGKSTLLKILSRITEPTEGRATIHGRVASLLEVGTGFHNELTGRENVYLNGAILGMSRREIDRKFDEIVDFAGVEKFLDTPIKRYSSGMKVRLAFAVAAHLDPEILIIDEVLAVGDAEFQGKCLGKMQDVATQGRTVLFVSHNMTAVRSLCSQAMSLDHGTIFQQGPTDAVVDTYLGELISACHSRSWDTLDDAPGNDRVRIRRLEVRSCSETAGDTLPITDGIEVAIEFWSSRESNLSISMHVQREGGMTAFASASPKRRVGNEVVTFTCEIPPNLLNDGHHSITLMIVENAKSVYTIRDALAFKTLEPARDSQWMGQWPGAVRPKLPWHVCSVAETAEVQA